MAASKPCFSKSDIFESAARKKQLCYDSTGEQDQRKAGSRRSKQYQEQMIEKKEGGKGDLYFCPIISTPAIQLTSKAR